LGQIKDEAAAAVSAVNAVANLVLALRTRVPSHVCMPASEHPVVVVDPDQRIRLAVKATHEIFAAVRRCLDYLKFQPVRND
jgi:hypothetical protein